MWYNLRTVIKNCHFSFIYYSDVNFFAYFGLRDQGFLKIAQGLVMVFYLGW